MKNKKSQSGLITILFILMMSIVATFILVVGQSRMLLSLERSKSATDTLLTNYSAESQISNFIAELFLGRFTQTDFSQFPQTITLDGGKLKITLEAKLLPDGSEEITATSQRAFSVNKIQAIKTSSDEQSTTELDLTLSLDCTGSMNEPAQKGGPSFPTRFDEQKRAALSFIDRINTHPKRDLINLGIIVFGVDAKWLKSLDGRDIKPDSGVSITDIRSAVNQRFGSLIDQSNACQTVMNATSIGSALALSRDFFKATVGSLHNQVQVVISDGEPNSRIPYPDCPLSVFCPAHGGSNYCRSNEYGWTCYGRSETECLDLGINFTRCTLADTAHGGVRNPNVDSYTVTVLDNPPANVVSILDSNSTEYYNTANATQLTSLLDTIFDDIIVRTSQTIIRRVIPE